MTLIFIFAFIFSSKLSHYDSHSYANPYNNTTKAIHVKKQSSMINNTIKWDERYDTLLELNDNNKNSDILEANLGFVINLCDCRLVEISSDIRKYLKDDFIHPHCLTHKTCMGSCVLPFQKCTGLDFTNTPITYKSILPNGAKRTKTINLREPTRCGCTCDDTLVSCLTPYSIFSKTNCRCVCNQTNFVSCGRRKMWSRSHCNCVCIPRSCVENHYMDSNTCECVAKMDLNDSISNGTHLNKNRSHVV